jgi:hypothetical protein
MFSGVGSATRSKSASVMHRLNKNEKAELKITEDSQCKLLQPSELLS